MLKLSHTVLAENRVIIDYMINVTLASIFSLPVKDTKPSVDVAT